MADLKHVLLLVETSKAYGRALLEGIGRYADAHGRWLMYVEERALYDQPPKWLSEWTGHGIIVRSVSQKLVEVIQKLGVPAVETNSQIQGHDFPLVYANEQAVAAIACEHFLERGFEHIGFCTIEEKPWVRIRREAFFARLAQIGLACHSLSVPTVGGRLSWDAQRQKLAAWVASLPKPVAILAANDVCGMRLIDACRSTDISVPEQVAVLGVDNDPALVRLTTPPMSSIDLNVTQTGFEAASLLDSLMRGGPKPEAPILVSPYGVVTRQTTDITAISDPELAEALRFIRNRAVSGITVSEVVRHVNVSRATLERRFSTVFGRTPKEEINRVRMAWVKRYLILTDYTVLKIAELTGFRSVSHLSITFKRYVGVSPTDFRKLTGSDSVPARHRKGYRDERKRATRPVGLPGPTKRRSSEPSAARRSTSRCREPLWKRPRSSSRNASSWSRSSAA